MIKLSELQVKEVIAIDQGKRLGHIHDLEIDPELGKILAIIILHQQKAGFFGRSEEIVVKWDQIHVIGEDLILVRLGSHLFQKES